MNKQDVAKEPLFTVVLLAYHANDYLEQALKSVLCQDYPAIELIVADDGSDNWDADCVEACIEANRKENLLRVQVVHHERNLGTVENANRALAQAQGQYLKLLAADDALYDGHVLSHARRALDACADGIVVGRVLRCSPELEPIAPFRDRFVRSLAYRSVDEVWTRLCLHNELPAPGVFFTRAFFDRFGPFDARYRLLEDWPTWLRISRCGVRISYGDFDAALYRSNSGSATAVNRQYLADKKLTFETEIQPYRTKLGAVRYLAARAELALRDAALPRRVYGFFFRR